LQLGRVGRVNPEARYGLVSDCENTSKSMSYGEKDYGVEVLESPPSKIFDHTELSSMLGTGTDEVSVWYRLGDPLMELEKVLSIQWLSTISNDLLFQVLPLIMASIETLALKNNVLARGQLIKLLRVFRIKVSQHPQIKLRFLILARSEPFKDFWKVSLIFDLDAYRESAAIHDDLKEYFDEDSEVLHIPNDDNCPNALKCFEVLSANKEFLVQFAATEIFIPGSGLKLRTRFRRFRFIKNSFRAARAVDTVLLKLGIEDRSRAVTLLDKMRQCGIISTYGKLPRPFEDNRRVWFWNSKVSVNRESACLRIQTGEKISCWKLADALGSHHVVTSIDMNIHVDMLDLQSFSFWTKDIFSVNADNEKFLAFKHVLHPLYKFDCMDFKRSVSNSEVSATEAKSDTSLSSAENITSSSFNGLCGAATSIDHVFCSIARPFILSLKYLPEGPLDGDVSQWPTCGSRLIVKKGDNLFQDLFCQTVFRFFDALWKLNGSEFPHNLIPFIYTYEVFPVELKIGFMEMVQNTVALKDFDWKVWKEKHSHDAQVLNHMVRSAAGAYIGAYALGVRDRHWDNVLIKDESVLIHIDFGFILGQAPPIDAPRFSISQSMQEAFESVGIWNDFLEVSRCAFSILRSHAGRISRIVHMLFEPLGFQTHVLHDFLHSKFSLNSHVSESESSNNIITQLKNSATAWKTKLKSLFHDSLDPMFYSLLKHHFPPAVLAMWIVDQQRDGLQRQGSKQRLRRRASLKTTSPENSDENSSPLIV